MHLIRFVRNDDVSAIMANLYQSGIKATIIQELYEYTKIEIICDESQEAFVDDIVPSYDDYVDYTD